MSKARCIRARWNRMPIRCRRIFHLLRRFSLPELQRLTEPKGLQHPYLSIVSRRTEKGIRVKERLNVIQHLSSLAVGHVVFPSVLAQRMDLWLAQSSTVLAFFSVFFQRANIEPPRFCIGAFKVRDCLSAIACNWFAAQPMAF